MNVLIRTVFSFALSFVATASLAQLAPEAQDLRTRFGSESPFAVLPTEMHTEDLVPGAAIATHEMQTADLRCQVGPEGRLIGCRVDWESLTHIGLCEAAIATATRVQLKDRFPDGRKLDGLYASMQMIFDVGGRPPFKVLPGGLHLSSAPIGRASHPFDQRAEQVGRDCPVQADHSL